MAVLLAKKETRLQMAKTQSLTTDRVRRSLEKRLAQIDKELAGYKALLQERRTVTDSTDGGHRMFRARQFASQIHPDGQ